MKFAESRVADFFFGAVFRFGWLMVLTTVLGFFATLHWVFDLFTHFKVQMALGLLLAAGLVFFSSRKKTSLLFLGVLSLHLIELVPFYLPRDKATGQGELKVILLNVNSSTGSPGRVRAYLQNSQADVVVIQEFSSRWAAMLEDLKVDYPHQVRQVREDNFGMALISKRPLLSREILYFTEAELPSIGVEINLIGERLFLLATHPFPPIGAAGTRLRNQQLEAIASFLGDSPGPQILVGDLNTSPWSPVFQALLKSTDLQNSMHGFGIQPTWPAQFPPLWVPLDHMLHTEDLNILEREIGPDVGSDHFPVKINIQRISKVSTWIQKHT